MKLIERYLDMRENNDRIPATRGNSYLGEDLLKGFGQRLKVEKLDLNSRTALAVIDTIIAGVELPKIYRHENVDGTFEVLFGKQILDTVYSVLMDEEQKSEAFVYNMFWIVNLQFVTFPPIVKRDVALAYAQTAIDLI